MTRHTLILATALFALVTTTTADQGARVTGTVAYRERIALTPNAVVEVSLEDVSRADAPATVIASLRIDRPGQVPIAFDLSYDPARIDSSGRYAVRARITESGRLVFTTTDAALVITQGHGHDVSLLLRGASAAATRAAIEPVPVTVPGQVPSLPRAISLTNLPATFAGTIPCADCAGIRYQLNLFSDDSYFLRRTYVGRPSAPSEDQIGSWVLSSDRRVLVLQGGGEPEPFAIRDNISLRKLDLDGRDIVSTLPYELRRAGRYQPIDLRATVQGLYRATRDGVEFTECSTGQTWQVADEAAARDLDAQYRAAVRKPSEAVLATIEGRIGSRSVSEQGAPAALVAERIVTLAPGGTCGPRFVNAPLAGPYWQLTRLGDTVVSRGSNAEPALTFRDEPHSFSGSDGCNRLAGNYEVAGDAMRLASVGTLMACPGKADTAFTSALKQVTRYRIAGHAMDFYDATHTRVARFQAREGR